MGLFGKSSNWWFGKNSLWGKAKSSFSDKEGAKPAEFRDPYSTDLLDDYADPSSGQNLNLLNMAQNTGADAFASSIRNASPATAGSGIMAQNVLDQGQAGQDKSYSNWQNQMAGKQGEAAQSKAQAQISNEKFNTERMMEEDKRRVAANPGKKGWGSGLGGKLLGAGLTWAFSDQDAKENIQYVDTSPEGHNIYNFNYKGHPKEKYQGTMAHEVSYKKPEAVGNKDGKNYVNYGLLDVVHRRIK